VQDFDSGRSGADLDQLMHNVVGYAVDRRASASSDYCTEVPQASETKNRVSLKRSRVLRVSPKSPLRMPFFVKLKGGIIDPVEWPSTRLNRRGQEGTADRQNNRPRATTAEHTLIWPMSWSRALRVVADLLAQACRCRGAGFWHSCPDGV
jgi:hypothetical protein